MSKNYLLKSIKLLNNDETMYSVFFKPSSSIQRERVGSRKTLIKSLTEFLQKTWLCDVATQAQSMFITSSPAQNRFIANTREALQILDSPVQIYLAVYTLRIFIFKRRMWTNASVFFHWKSNSFAQFLCLQSIC